MGEHLQLIQDREHPIDLIKITTSPQGTSICRRTLTTGQDVHLQHCTADEEEDQHGSEANCVALSQQCSSCVGQRDRNAAHWRDRVDDVVSDNK